MRTDEGGILLEEVECLVGFFLFLRGMDGIEKEGTIPSRKNTSFGNRLKEGDRQATVASSKARRRQKHLSIIAVQRNGKNCWNFEKRQ